MVRGSGCWCSSRGSELWYLFLVEEIEYLRTLLPHKKCADHHPKKSRMKCFNVRSRWSFYFVSCIIADGWESVENAIAHFAWVMKMLHLKFKIIFVWPFIESPDWSCFRIKHRFETSTKYDWPERSFAQTPCSIESFHPMLKPARGPSTQRNIKKQIQSSNSNRISSAP